jgi:hypothetical protein
MPFLNSRIPWPTLRPVDGRRLAPNRMTSTRITMRYLSSTGHFLGVEVVTTVAYRAGTTNASALGQGLIGRMRTR